MTMDKETKIKKRIGWLFFLLGVLVVLFFLTACSPKTIYVPEVHTEYITRTDTFVKVDSVSVKDSIYVTEKGDTVRIERWHVQYRDRWREKIVRDTIIKTDSIPVPYPMEKKLTMAERFDIYLNAMCLVLGLLAVFVVVWLIIKWKNKKAFNISS